MGINLPVIWGLIIAVGVLIYIIVDGFDLGIGILFSLVKDRTQRDQMVNTVAPVWDGNETWLVLGGAALMAAFPPVYSVLLSALYLPLILMLVGLIWRGVAFEFRFKAHTLAHRLFWDKAFLAGSVLSAFCQGVTIGSLVQGIATVHGTYAGGTFDWLTPFSLLCGLGLVATYALLGCGWLIMKTAGELRQRMCYHARSLALVLLVLAMAVMVVTPLVSSAIKARWASAGDGWWLLALLALYLVWRLVSAAAQQKVWQPFVLALGIVVLGYLGLLLSLWPNILPPNLTLVSASSPAQSQGFALVGALVLIPLILVYSAWSYYVFRGQIRPNDKFDH